MTCTTFIWVLLNFQNPYFAEHLKAIASALCKSYLHKNNKDLGTITLFKILKEKNQSKKSFKVNFISSKFFSEYRYKN